MERYRKFIVAAIAGAVAIVAVVWPGNSTAAAIVAIVSSVLSALGVLAVRNEPMPPAALPAPLSRRY